MLALRAVLFGVSAEQDAKDATETIAAVDQTILVDEERGVIPPGPAR